MVEPKGPFTTIEPGLYLDADGNLVFDIGEMLTHAGIEDTSDNRIECMEAIQEMVGATATLQGKVLEIQYRLPEDSYWKTGSVPTRKED